MIRAKPNELRIAWTRDRTMGPDFAYAWGDGCHKSDARLLHLMLETKTSDGVTVLDELKARGYDLTTIRFSVKKAAK